MGKIVVVFTTLFIALYADEASHSNQQLHKKCLECHKQEQIPTELIYRRYLMTYSTKEEMQNAIFEYLKDPQQENSIMPPPFFIKFPMKEALDMDDEELHKNISDFLDYLDVKKRLIL